MSLKACLSVLSRSRFLDIRFSVSMSCHAMNAENFTDSHSSLVSVGTTIPSWVSSIFIHPLQFSCYVRQIASDPVDFTGQIVFNLADFIGQPRMRLPYGNANCTLCSEYGTNQGKNYLPVLQKLFHTYPYFWSLSPARASPVRVRPSPVSFRLSPAFIKRSSNPSKRFSI